MVINSRTSPSTYLQVSVSSVLDKVQSRATSVPSLENQALYHTCVHCLQSIIRHQWTKLSIIPPSCTFQAVLHSFKEVPGLKDFQRWLGEEIQQEAQRGKHEVTNMSLHFSGVGSHARLFEALAAMLSRNALNPADVSILHRYYAEEESPPPAHYLHVPQLLGRFCP